MAPRCLLHAPLTALPASQVLYLKQSYPDNYVDSSFLSDLQRNGTLHYGGTNSDLGHATDRPSQANPSFATHL